MSAVKQEVSVYIEKTMRNYLHNQQVLAKPAPVAPIQKVPDVLKPVEEEKQEVQPVADKPIAFNADLLGEREFKRDVKPREILHLSWKMKNTGSEIWPGLIQVSSSDQKLRIVVCEITPMLVKPGHECQVKVSIEAPEQPGNLTTEF